MLKKAVMLSLSKQDREAPSHEAHRQSPFDKLRVTIHSTYRK